MRSLNHVQQDPSQVETLRTATPKHLRREVIERCDRGDCLAATLACLLVAGHQLDWVLVGRGSEVPVGIIDEVAIPRCRPLAEQNTAEPAVLDQ